MKKRLFTALSALVLSALSLNAQQIKEGYIVYDMKMEGLPPEQAAMMGDMELKSTFKNGKSLTEMSSMMFSNQTMMDETGMVMLMEQMGNKIAIKQTKEEMEKAEAKAKEKPVDPKFEYTTETKTIAGYECKKVNVTSFTKLQNDLKNVEAEMLQVFSGASGKLAIKFDHLEAKVIAPSSYIQAGQQYQADIFLAASSSKLGAGDLEVLMGADSASTSGGNAIPIENGMGKYTVGTSGQGEQTYKGVIKFKKPDGSYDRYPFSATYMVAAPATAVEAEKMNVFYIGVENPIAVSAAGVSPTDLIVNAVGGGVVKTGGAGGKFVLKFSTPGECSISVSAKTKDGNKPQGPPKKFRVKKIPDPVAKVGGKTGTVDMKKSELAAIGGVGAELAGFDFDAKFIVVSFELSAVVKGALKSEVCPGNSLSAGARTILGTAGVGSKIFVENVKAKGPDGTIRSIPGVTIKVK